MLVMSIYSKTCVKRPLTKRLKIWFQDQLSLNPGQKYCRMLHGEHSAILWTFIKLPIVIKIFVLSIFEWPFYTEFTVLHSPWIRKYWIFYAQKFCLSWPMASHYWGDKCIQNIHLQRYIFGHAVGNLVLRRSVSGAVNCDFRPYIWR